MGGIADAIQGHLGIDSKRMATDLNAIVKETSWLGVSLQTAESRNLPNMWMK